MKYEALTPSDLANITALNNEFLRLLGGRSCVDQTEKTICALEPAQRAWLARTPILLFSVRERDLERWGRVKDVGHCPDLFVQPDVAEQPLAQIGGVAAAFAWQLAQRNPYSLRLLFDASSDWIDMIASARFLDVVKFAQLSPDLVVLRQNEQPAFWQRLLGAGVSREPDVRHAARLSALQSVYTSARDDDGAGAWPAAACAAPKPRLRVADATAAARRRKGHQSE